MLGGREAGQLGMMGPWVVVYIIFLYLSYLMYLLEWVHLSVFAFPLPSYI